MRSDSEIKSKIIELLGVEGSDRSEQVQQLDRLDPAALDKVNIAHHSSRGMLCGLYWVLGYEFRDMARIIESAFAADTEEISKPVADAASATTGELPAATAPDGETPPARSEP